MCVAGGRAFSPTATVIYVKRERAESSFFSCWCVYFRRASCLAMCTHWQFAVDRHCVAMCTHRPCLADLHGSGARFHSQCKKEQQKCRETTETQRNFVINIECCIWFANSLFFLQRRYRDMHSVTVKALAGGREFSPPVSQPPFSDQINQKKWLWPMAP